MDYKLEARNGKINLLSSKTGMYVMEDASIYQVKIAVATEMEYSTKLEIVKLLMTFPHGFLTTNNEIIVKQKAVDEYEAWYKEIYKLIAFLDEYYALIDKKIQEIFS
ncbi:hypothetical protein [Senegalia massiliensis]|uniref:hypothetical protein n=1 Tax=Senegalia massiliensis TaxID=1720316 RepID=UPI001030CE24|nr:hypothetical protein [Senegalia massiliensis]